MFIYYSEREKEWAWASREGEEREEIKNPKQTSRLWVVSTEPDAWLDPTSCEIVTWGEVGHLTDWATQAPQVNHNIFKYMLFSFSINLDILLEGKIH